MSAERVSTSIRDKRVTISTSINAISDSATTSANP
ncbi:MAG: hypothetical protein ACI91V_000987 [Lentimonas sp.]